MCGAKLSSWLQWSFAFFPNYLLFSFFKQVWDTLPFHASKLCFISMGELVACKAQCSAALPFQTGNWTGEICGSAGEVFCTCFCMIQYILLRLNIYCRKAGLLLYGSVHLLRLASCSLDGPGKRHLLMRTGSRTTVFELLDICDPSTASSQFFRDLIWFFAVGFTAVLKCRGFL